MLRDTTLSTTHNTCVLSQEALVKGTNASYERQLALFDIGLEILGEKKKKRFLLYLLSLQKPDQQNQETPRNEL
jgi:hypothetical protein